MARKLNFKKKKINESVESIILEFLNAKGYPQRFGEIRNYLKDHDIVYANSDKDRSGLSHTLNRLTEQNKIKKIPKDNFNKYPTYITIEKSTFDAGFDGYLTRVEATAFLFKAEPYLRITTDIENMYKREKPFDYNEEIIQKLIVMLGMQIIYSVILGYERPINRDKKEKIKKSDLDSWMKNALAFNDPLEPIGDIVAKHLPDLTTDKLKKILRNMYPIITERLENSREDFDKLRNDLRESYLMRRDYAQRMRQ